MFQATRRRLAIWYTAVTAVLLLLFATGVYLYVRSTLIERVDDTLNHVVEVVVRSLVIEPVEEAKGKHRVNIEASFRDNADTTEDDRIDLEWFSPTGELLWSTFTEPLNVPIHANRTGETVRVIRGAIVQGSGGAEELLSGGAEVQGSRGAFPPHQSRRTGVSPVIPSHQSPGFDVSAQPNVTSPESPIAILRQVTERVEIGRQVLGYLRVSHPWFEVTKPSRQLILDLSMGTTFMVISVAAIGWLLSGLAMEPVRQSYQSLKQFTSDASHELRSPIAMIQTNVQAALADPALESVEHRQQLKVVERLTQRLGRLVDDLLFLARQDSGIVQPRFSPCPLDALLMEAMEEQQLLAREKGIKLSLDLKEGTETWGIGKKNNSQLLTSLFEETEEEFFTLQADWDQLARLFTNLIGNALQYTPAEGEVDVELQRIIRRGNHPHLQVKVKDTGVGIPEDALPHIFDRFYRADPARSRGTATGSGLGLAIAAAIVENHHGNIRIDSILNRGTIVTVTLPQYRPESFNSQSFGNG